MSQSVKRQTWSGSAKGMPSCSQLCQITDRPFTRMLSLDHVQPAVKAVSRAIAISGRIFEFHAVAGYFLLNIFAWSGIEDGATACNVCRALCLVSRSLFALCHCIAIAITGS